MKRIALVLALSMGAAGAASLATQSSEEAAVRRALDHYLQAHATGEGAHARMAFWPSANLYWSRGDSMNIRSSEAYASGFNGKPAADESARKRRIVSVDVSGSAAIAKMEKSPAEWRFATWSSFVNR